MIRYLTALIFASSLFAQEPLHYLDLGGNWKLHSGDQIEFAQPQLDDRSWTPLQLPWSGAPPQGRFWLRKNVELPDGFDSSRLSVRLGPVAEMYELYVNGRLAGTTGGFDELASGPPQARSFEIPAEKAGSRLVLAIRALRADGDVYLAETYAGGDYLLIAGHAQRQAENSYAVAVRAIPIVALAAVRLSFGLVILMAWAGQRRRFDLLWLALFVFVSSMSSLLNWWSVLPDAPSLLILRTRPFVEFLSGFALAGLTVSVSGLSTYWVWLLCAGTWLIYLNGERLGWLYRTGDMVSLGILALAAWRSRRRWPVYGALAIVILGHLNRSGVFGMQAYVDVGSFHFGVNATLITLFAIALTFALVRETITDRQEKLRLSAELESAKALQQLLLSPIEDSRYEAAYVPALEVGGDFWQVLPAFDGSGEIVALGDVSGKGLRAAMVVSLVIGALRNRKSDEPAEILRELNRVACHVIRGGFVTAIVARIDGDRAGIANAGHPAAYLNGAEFQMDAGLPLGIDPDVVYCTRDLPGGCLLTLISDGVLEATNAKGELFGFERTAAISTKSAAEIAEAARAWGQTDDITVVTVRKATT